MKPQRPVGALVMGIINLVFGVTGLLTFVLCAVGAVGFYLMANNPPGGGLATYWRLLNEELPSYKLLLFTYLALGLPESLAMIASGLGLVLGRPWGRTLGLWYGVFLVSFYSVTSVYELALHVPAEARIAEQMVRPGTQAGSGSAAFTAAMVVANLAYSLAHGGALIIVLTRPTVRAAFRGPVLVRPAGPVDPSDQPGHPPP